MKYYIIAGEASGDLHGSNLVASIRQKDPGAKIRAWVKTPTGHLVGVISKSNIS